MTISGPSIWMLWLVFSTGTGLDYDLHAGGVEALVDQPTRLRPHGRVRYDGAHGRSSRSVGRVR